MSKRAHVMKPVWEGVSPFEKERLRLIELQMGGYITKKEYADDMAAVARAERDAERAR